MKQQLLMVSCALMLIAAPATAQTGVGAGTGKGAGAAPVTTVKIEDAQSGPKFVRTLTNVQIELNLTDQLGSLPPEKKTVSMIAMTGNWSKIRSAGQVFPAGEPPYVVQLNVDARPHLSTEGQIQLELTFEYAPLKSGGEQKEGARQRPSGINQSQTVILQSGKPLIVSQAADPISDRKVVVEVKATVLK